MIMDVDSIELGEKMWVIFELKLLKCHLNISVYISNFINGSTNKSMLWLMKRRLWYE